MFPRYASRRATFGTHVTEVVLVVGFGNALGIHDQSVLMDADENVPDWVLNIRIA